MSAVRDEPVQPLLVLVVDDDREIREVVRAALSRESIDVAEASTAREGLARALELKPDVAILDVQLPDVSGLELLREMRSRMPGIHVIMLTSASQEDDLVSGLAGGADDYVVKPFSPRELAARVVAARRRLGWDALSVIAVGDVYIDVGAHRAMLGDRVLELTKLEFALLAFLAGRPGQAFTRAELLRDVWSSSAEWQGEATVTEHVRRLRVKIERDPRNPELVVAIRGVGYRFDPGTGRHAASS